VELSTQSQLNVREPRGNRGRLRHCNGLQTPNATVGKDGKAGARLEARSQDTGLVVLVAAIHEVANFSVKEKDETSPPTNLAALLNPFILQIDGV
jgi:hypothetical protein